MLRAPRAVLNNQNDTIPAGDRAAANTGKRHSTRINSRDTHNGAMDNAAGTIHGALDRLFAATFQLLAPQKQYIADAYYEADPLYAQLRQGMEKQRGLGSGATGSQLPVSVNALQLVTEIDDTVAAWAPAGDSTPDRLQGLLTRPWGTEDAGAVHQLASVIESWAQDVRDVLDPKPTRHVAAPCPACGAKTVYRRDDAGETVRQPALQLISETGCRCCECRSFWPPEHYELLASVLSFDDGRPAATV